MRSQWIPALSTALLWVGCAAPAEEAASASPADRVVPIRFALEVGSDVQGPIYVQLSGEDNQPGWISAFRGSERVYFRERCEIEDCGSNAVCGVSIPMVQDIADPGATGVIELMWDGLTSVADPVAGCELRQPAPQGEYVARFCYSREAELEGGVAPTNPVPGGLVRATCTDLPFTLLEREVVLRI